MALRYLRSNLIAFPLGLKQSQVPTGLSWILDLTFKAPGELALLCSPAYPKRSLKCSLCPHLRTISWLWLCAFVHHVPYSGVLLFFQLGI